jgi:hypothetical protein
MFNVAKPMRILHRPDMIFRGVHLPMVCKTAYDKAEVWEEEIDILQLMLWKQTKIPRDR